LNLYLSSDAEAIAAQRYSYGVDPAFERTKWGTAVQRMGLLGRLVYLELYNAKLQSIIGKTAVLYVTLSTFNTSKSSLVLSPSLLGQDTRD
jgi:hypothetical protein